MTTAIDTLRAEVEAAFAAASKAATAAVKAANNDGLAYCKAALLAAAWKAATDSNREAAESCKVNKDTLAKYAIAAAVIRKDDSEDNRKAATVLRSAIESAIKRKVSREDIRKVIDDSGTIAAAAAAVRKYGKDGNEDGKDGKDKGDSKGDSKVTLASAIKRAHAAMLAAAAADMMSLDSDVLTMLAALPKMACDLYNSVERQQANGSK